MEVTFDHPYWGAAATRADRNDGKMVDRTVDLTSILDGKLNIENGMNK